MGQKNHQKKRSGHRKIKMTSDMSETPATDQKKTWIALLQQPKVLIPAAVFIVLYIAFNLWLFFYGPKVFDQGKKPTAIGNFATRMALVKPKELIKTPTPQSIPSPTKAPTKLKPDDGTKGTYSVSMAKHDGPTITKVIFDPLDVQKGQSLIVTANLINSVPIKQLTGTLKTDHGELKIIFSRTSGTDTNGSWQGKFPLNDSVLYTYILTLSAEADNGKGEVITAPRSQ